MTTSAKGRGWLRRSSGATGFALVMGLLVAGLGAHLAGAESAHDVLLPPEMVSVDGTSEGLVRTEYGLELDGLPYSGRLFERFDDGTLRRSTTYRDGVPSGDQIEWSPDGSLLSWKSLAKD